MTDFETHPVGTGKRIEQLVATCEELEAKCEAREKLVLRLAGDKIDLVSELAGVKGKLADALDALQLADDDLTNLQPKIAQLVPAPWTAVIDGYVDPVIKTARATIEKLKGQDDG